MINELPECQIREVQLPFSIFVWCYGSFRAHQKFILHPGGTLHMYLALQLFNLLLGSALLQFNFPSCFTSYELTLKIVLL
jgi:hypothetical protein